MVLHLEVKAVRPEEVPVVQRTLLCHFHLAVEDGLRDVAGEAGAERDYPLVVLLQQLVVDARLVIEAFGVPEGAERHEVGVARGIAGKKNEVVMPRPFFASRLVRARAGRLVELRADDRRDALLAAFLVERHGPEHIAVVGERKMAHAEALRLGHERIDGGGSVEEGEIGMAMEMDERCHAVLVPPGSKG